MFSSVHGIMCTHAISLGCHFEHLDRVEALGFALAYLRFLNINDFDLGAVLDTGVQDGDHCAIVELAAFPF